MTLFAGKPVTKRSQSIGGNKRRYATSGEIAVQIEAHGYGIGSLKHHMKAAEEATANLRLEPGKNKLTGAKTAETAAGNTSDESNGIGLLDIGTKAFVEAVKLVDNDVGEMYAMIMIGGKMYHVKGDMLTE